ncbi:type II toxin-antitoxin system VapC family toxin [Zavarzinia sp. CC-PAN008]|uniref:type II toxin-antitoxin system VapC family toxin n=1 Tax=Zavarzinia sp. CC-PAN008 TaxID=3243332 RepID=UPI003F749E27
MAERFLVDTHVFAWLLTEPGRVRGSVLQRISNPAASLLVSAASLWEASIKISLGKWDRLHESVDHGQTLAMTAREAGMTILPIDAVHAEQTRTIPSILRDPFDRMLVAQAQVETLILVTRDETLASYPGVALLLA